VFNYSGVINYLKRRFPFLNQLTNFYEFICENNPMLLDYYDHTNEDNDDTNEPVVEQPKKVLVKFEDKYLARFKAFPNEFRIDETEFKQENEEYEKIKLDYEKTRLDTINAIQERLFKINQIQEEGDISHKNERYTENINAFGINCLIKFFDIEEEYNRDQDDFDIEEIYQHLLKDKEELLKKMDETEKMIMTEEEMRKKSREVIINKKLDKFINNYVLEHTPLGNIYMRYNNDKKSFEYFSNNTIPYRYLEPVARKYVMTYWCKPIFVDIEQELKRAEVKFDEGIKIKEAYEKRRQEETKNNPKDVVARMKSYNKETKSQTIMQQPMKNRSANNILPPQIKANFPNVNQHSEKQLLKEQANRYTWEGRLTTFSPLKSIDKKVLDKNLTMSYADFKRMKQEEKNKK
jgi:hypothetical protein